MSDFETLMAKADRSSNNFRFRDLCRLAELAGFILEKRGGTSHLQYHHPAVRIRISLLEAGHGRAKPYQLRQILRFIEQHVL